MFNSINKIALLIPAVLFLALIGCQSTSAHYQGKHVEPRFAISLHDNGAEEHWQTHELTIIYGYTKDQRNLRIEGQINLADQYAEIYHYLDRLDIYLLFLDRDLTVVRVETLASGFSYTPKDSIPFSGSFLVPPEAVSLSFAYYGTVREMDRKDGNTATLFHVPK